MPATYEPIATTTLSSAASTITFSSIPATYTDLKWVLVAKGTGSGNLLLRFNSDTAANYSSTWLEGSGTAASSGRGTSNTSIIVTFGGTGVNTNWHYYEGDVFSYAGSTNKTCLLGNYEDQNGSGSILKQVGLWRNTAAITTLTLSMQANNFDIGTTATLYGILKA